MQFKWSLVAVIIIVAIEWKCSNLRIEFAWLTCKIYSQEEGIFSAAVSLPSGPIGCLLARCWSLQFGSMVRDAILSPIKGWGPSWVSLYHERSESFSFLATLDDGIDKFWFHVTGRFIRTNFLLDCQPRASAAYFTCQPVRLHWGQPRAQWWLLKFRPNSVTSELLESLKFSHWEMNER